MDKRDRLIRQTDVLSRTATRPLREPAGGEAARLALESVVARLGEAIELLEPLIELLFHACQKLRLTVPGVGDVELRHRRTRKGNEVVAYLVKRMPGEPALARRIQIGVFRFYDAEGGHREGGAALEAGVVPPQLLERLRLKLYYLMHYHVDFADEPVLSQLFPGPRTVKQAAPVVSNAERMRRKSRLEAAIAKAEALYYQLEPAMQAIALLLRALRDPLGFTVKDIMSPQGRMVRLMAFRLTEDAAARQLLESALADFQALEQAIAEAKAAEDPQGLEEVAFPLSSFLLTCRAHPALRELVPAGAAPTGPL